MKNILPTNLIMIIAAFALPGLVVTSAFAAKGKPPVNHTKKHKAAPATAPTPSNNDVNAAADSGKNAQIDNSSPDSAPPMSKSETLQEVVPSMKPNEAAPSNIMPAEPENSAPIAPPMDTNKPPS